jgi:hypothetical protein
MGIFEFPHLTLNNHLEKRLNTPHDVEIPVKKPFIETVENFPRDTGRFFPDQLLGAIDTGESFPDRLLGLKAHPLRRCMSCLMRSQTKSSSPCNHSAMVATSYLVPGPCQPYICVTKAWIRSG